MKWNGLARDRMGDLRHGTRRQRDQRLWQDGYVALKPIPFGRADLSVVSG